MTEIVLLAVLAAAALLVALAILGVRLYGVLRELREAEPEGVTLDSPPLPPAEPEPAEPTASAEAATPRRAGRHYHDTVEIVPTGWMPPIGRHRIAAALDDTQAIRIDDIEEPQP